MSDEAMLERRRAMEDRRDRFVELLGKKTGVRIDRSSVRAVTGASSLAGEQWRARGRATPRGQYIYFLGHDPIDAIVEAGEVEIARSAFRRQFDVYAHPRPEADDG